MSTHKLVRYIATLALACLVAGCAAGSKRKVEITGPAPAQGQSLAIDVTNFNGSVIVDVDEHRSTPSVRAHLSAPKGAGRRTKRALMESVWIGAEVVEEEGGLILRALSRPSDDLEGGDEVRVTLKVRVPACDGVLVRNTGGKVLLRQVQGAIQVENGFAGEGGPIDVRTDHALDAPIALTTPDGNVFLQFASNSKGHFEVITDDGEAIVRTQSGLVTGVTVSPGQWEGTVNSGSNPVLLRTGSGNARVLMLENAATSIPSK